MSIISIFKIKYSLKKKMKFDLYFQWQERRIKENKIPKTYDELVKIFEQIFCICITEKLKFMSIDEDNDIIWIKDTEQLKETLEFAEEEEMKELVIIAEFDSSGYEKSKDYLFYSHMNKSGSILEDPEEENLSSDDLKCLEISNCHFNQLKGSNFAQSEPNINFGNKRDKSLDNISDMTGGEGESEFKPKLKK